MKREVKMLLIGLIISFLICDGLLILYLNQETKQNKNCLISHELNGTSMNPTFYEGTRVIINTCDDNYQVGDVVAFNRPGAFIFHRILVIDYEKEIFIAKGDNNIFHDGENNISQIYGKFERLQSEAKKNV